MSQQWNICVSCGESIPENRPAFAGYGCDNQPLVVGACCSKQLTKLATPVYWTGTLNLSIADDKAVWRYMDLAKFIAMLKQRGLFFVSAKNFLDPFEGAIGLASRQKTWDKFYLDFFREAVTTAPRGYLAPDLTEQEIENNAQRLLASTKASSPHVRNSLVSCWHENEDESEALWQLYCPASGSGIAIKTSVGDLWDATSEAGHVVIGPVKCQ